MSKKKPPNCEGGGFEVNMIFDVFVWESGVARPLMLSILNRSGGVRKCEIGQVNVVFPAPSFELLCHIPISAHVDKISSCDSQHRLNVVGVVVDKVVEL